jgi:hypothetical protein
MALKKYVWGLAGLWLLVAQTAAANAEEVPFGGDSLFPWVIVGLTIVSVIASAIWMKRGGRF